MALSTRLIVIPSEILASVQFLLSAMVERNTGTLLMQDLSSFDPGQVLQPLNWQGLCHPLPSLFLTVICLHFRMQSVQRYSQS